ncbi:hypothetical protein BVC80_7393g5 [Macleaya cordata]|uniref:Transmembrane protein n=1 Tax=Macleaya cordata TaxID=56857 RepID=A0A200QB10_MACCD|nr:hypothetical protein BVC80_7393g5 [Macleaya cordata]
MATTALPDQPEQQQPAIYPQAAVSLASASGGAWRSSGSIGPFFAVMAVLTVLTVLSCLLSRICSRRASAPPLDIRYGDCIWWLQRKCSRCISSHDFDVEVGTKVVARKEINNGKSQGSTEIAAASSPPPST